MNERLLETVYSEGFDLIFFCIGDDSIKKETLEEIGKKHAEYIDKKNKDENYKKEKKELWEKLEEELKS